jgi:thiamine-phosphate pyrophosphorylase
MAPSRAADRRALELFAVTPGRGDGDEVVRALPTLRARGASALLLREKQLDAARRRALAESVAPRCRDAGLALWIAEDVELALAVGAAGVQLSERSPSPLAVRSALARSGGADRLALGVSLHDPISRSREELEICAHAFLGPLFPTPSKPRATPLGVARFLELAATLPCPAFAVGGVTEPRLAELAAAGVRRAAAIRLFFDVAGDAADRGATA